jgi:hypothetical protein
VRVTAARGSQRDHEHPAAGFLIQQVQIEPLTGHLMIVLQTTTG